MDRQANRQIDIVTCRWWDGWIDGWRDTDIHTHTQTHTMTLFYI